MRRYGVGKAETRKFRENAGPLIKRRLVVRRNIFSLQIFQRPTSTQLNIVKQRETDLSRSFQTLSWFHDERRKEDLRIQA